MRYDINKDNIKRNQSIYYYNTDKNFANTSSHRKLILFYDFA